MKPFLRLQLLEAHAAQCHWADRPLSERLRIVRAFRHLLATEAEAVAATALGPSFRDPAEILAAEFLPLVDACRFLERQAPSILAPRHVGGRGRALWLWGAQATVWREPCGVVLIVAPSNYPLFLPGVQLLQALVAGNAVLLKPGHGGTAAARELDRLLRLAGLPAGLVQVLPEAVESVQAALEVGVQKVVFTGSAAVGTQILSELAVRAIPATMELSGCDAVFVRADADLDLAVRALVFGLRLNSGQTCIAPRRVFVARAVATELEGRLAEALCHCPLSVLAPDPTARLLPLLVQALGTGAHLLCGEVHSGQTLIGPLVLAGISLSSRLLQEDFFAPVMLIVTVSGDDEALAFAANGPYALGATIFSRDRQAAHSLAQRVNAGAVVINDMIVPTADARLPFGGRKLSGFGVTRGPEGLLEMTTHKVISVRSGRRHPHLDAPASGDGQLFGAYLVLAHAKGFGLRCRALFRLLRSLFQRR
ncbi:MAG TPA: aldehyde dehydrogenase family protein, partial [Bacillota bacterium]|nr:aldehyde dehydrogenase family protein [Bacillota bacterium]